MDTLTMAAFCVLLVLILGLAIAVLAISKPHKICPICGHLVEPWEQAEYPHGKSVVHKKCRNEG
jgi:hypothetical protein